METTTTTVEHMSKALARLDGNGIHLTGWGIIAVVVCLMFITSIILMAHPDD